MIVSTRENKDVRKNLLHLGITQISGGSKTSVGGYSEPEKEEENSAQFDVSDLRTLDEVVRWLVEMGYVPSFCTACYRSGRVGEDFMKICKERQIQNFCQPNAIITLKEYLTDYASDLTKTAAEKIIKEEVQNIQNELIKSKVQEDLKNIEKGVRDYRF